MIHFGNLIVRVIEDLCLSNLDEFMVAAQTISIYNQQHMIEQGTQLTQEFPNRFFEFIKNNTDV